MSSYPARRRRNAVWMGLSVAAAAFGLTWLFLILARAVLAGIRRAIPRRLHADDPAPGQRRRAPERDRRQPDHDGDRRRCRRAAGHAGGHLSGGIRPPFEARSCRSLHQRHPAQRPLDRDRAFHLPDRSGADGPFLGHRRRDRPGCPGRSGRGSDHRRHAQSRSQHIARGRRPRSACRAPWSFSASAIARRGPAC